MGAKGQHSVSSGLASAAPVRQCVSSWLSTSGSGRRSAGTRSGVGRLVWNLPQFVYRRQYAGLHFGRDTVELGCPGEEPGQR
jgi:hypothetical protein